MFFWIQKHRFLDDLVLALMFFSKVLVVAHCCSLEPSGDFTSENSHLPDARFAATLGRQEARKANDGSFYTFDQFASNSEIQNFRELDVTASGDCLDE